MFEKIQMKYGRETKEISIPRHNLMGILEPENLPGAEDPREEIKQALANPWGTPLLREMARNKKNVVILCSDISRPAPSKVILPPLLEELNQAGVKDNQVTVIFGLGFHRPHTPQEHRQLVGEEIYRRLRCLDHNFLDCVPIGKTSRGTPVQLFRPVANADLIIATGNLELHRKAGYTGGDKALMPGVCSQESIQSNHRMMLQPGAGPGRITGNPVREDIEEAGKMAGLAFIVNVVLNCRQEIIKAVAGDRIQAHREGIQYVDRMYKRTIPQLADIGIAACGGFPKDLNLYQAQKALENASHAVREGGAIILLAECGEMYGNQFFEEWMTRARTPDDPFNWMQQEFVLGAHKAVALCRVLQKQEVYLVSKMPDEAVRNCFLQPAESVEQALAKALEKLGRDSRILALPYANSTLPLLKT